MPVRFTCPQCKDTGVVPDEMAGKEAKCTCGFVLTVPPLGGAPAEGPVLPLHRTGLDRRVGERRKSDDGIPAVDQREVVDRRSGDERREAPTEPHRGRIVFLPLLLGVLDLVLGVVAIRAWSADGLRRAEERHRVAIAFETGGEGMIRVQEAALAHARKLAGPTPSPAALREIARLDEHRAKLVDETRTAPGNKAEAEREIGSTLFTSWAGGAFLGVLTFACVRFLLSRTR